MHSTPITREKGEIYFFIISARSLLFSRVGLSRFPAADYGRRRQEIGQFPAIGLSKREQTPRDREKKSSNLIRAIFLNLLPPWIALNYIKLPQHVACLYFLLYTPIMLVLQNARMRVESSERTILLYTWFFFFSMFHSREIILWTHWLL